MSDRQWRDIAAIVRVQGSRLDVEYLREGAGALGVTDLLEQALAESRPQGRVPGGRCPGWNPAFVVARDDSRGGLNPGQALQPRLPG